MGMFDNLVIDKKHLPDKLKNYTDGWRTKSLECYLSTYKILGNGSLEKTDYYDGLNGDWETKPFEYTGEVRFNRTIYEVVNGKPNDYWCEFVAFFENGKMFKLIQVQPKNKNEI
jgi:hypothetical protein